jgi:PAS domain S-box-containing protein
MRQSEQQFRNLIEGSIQGVVVFVDDKPVFANQAMANILGHDGADDIIRMKSSSGFVHPAEIERIAGYRRDRLRGGAAPDIYEFRAVRKDGSIVWLESRPTIAEWDGKHAIQTACVDITQRKHAEQALSESEARFRDFAESTSDWFWETDEQHRFTSFAEDSSLYAGPGLAPALGKTRFEDRLAEDRDDAKWEAHRANLDARRAFQDFVYGRVDTNGDIRQIKVNGKPIFDDEGAFAGYRGTASDVTEVIGSEERARTAQRRLAAAVEGLAETFLLFDKDDRLVLANRAYRERNAAIEAHIQPGMSFGDMLAAAIRAGAYPAAIGGEEAWIRGRLAKHRHPQGSFAMERSGGEHFIVRDRVLPDGGFVTTATDVTELKRREEKFQSLLESAPDAMVIVDVDGKITDVNRQSEKLFGYAHDELIGEPVETLVPKRFSSQHIAHRRRYADAPRARPMAEGQDLYCLTKAGTEVPVEIASARSTRQKAFWWRPRYGTSASARQWSRRCAPAITATVNWWKARSRAWWS